MPEHYSPFLLKLAMTPYLPGKTEQEISEARGMIAMALGQPKRAVKPRAKRERQDTLRKWLGSEMERRCWSAREAARQLAVDPKDVTRFLAGKREDNGRPLTKALKEKMKAAVRALRSRLQQETDAPSKQI